MKQKEKQQKPEKKLWFRAKCYGWGWYPCSWEGWLVILIWAIFFTLSMVKLNQEW